MCTHNDLCIYQQYKNVTPLLSNPRVYDLINDFSFVWVQVCAQGVTLGAQALNIN